MSGSVNKVILVGNLGKDPEVKFTPSGQAVANFNVATSEQWKDKNSGEKQERTEWSRIVVWGKTAENCGQYLGKGSKVYLEGRLQTREWQDKDGQKRWTTEVVADRVVFLDKKGERNEAPAKSGPADDFGPPPSPNSAQDDIPF